MFESLIEAGKKTASKIIGSVTKLMGDTKSGVAPAVAATMDVYDRAGMVTSTGMPGIDQVLRLEQDVLQRFQDYENMDDDPILSVCLDIMAEDATQMDPRRENKVIHVEGDNQDHVDIAQECIETLELDSTLENIVREYAKYGSDYEENVLDEKTGGVVALNYLPPALTTRVEDDKGMLIGFYYGLDAHQKPMVEIRQLWQELMSKNGGPGPHGEQAWTWWQITQFRLQTKNRRCRTGTSALDAARSPWKRLMLVEDASVLHKLTRAPARDVFSVEMGDLPDKLAMAHLRKVKAQHKKRSYIDPTTGQIASTYAPLSIPDDYYLPMKGGVKQVEIEQLEPRDWQSTDLIEYFQSKVFAATTVPKAWLSFTEDMQSRATLSQQDIRFARGELRKQSVAIEGIKHILAVNFASKGIDPDSVDLKISLTVSSAIFELVQMEVERVRTDVAQGMQQYVSQEWIQKKLFGMSDKEIKKDWKRRKIEAQLQAEIEAAAQPPEPDWGGGDQAQSSAPDAQFASPTDQGQDMGGSEAGAVEDVAQDVKNAAKVADTGKDRTSKKKVKATKTKEEREWGQKLDRLLADNVDLRQRVVQLREMVKAVRAVGGY